MPGRLPRFAWSEDHEWLRGRREADVMWLRAQLGQWQGHEDRLACSTRSVKDAARRAGVSGRRRLPQAAADGSAWAEPQLYQDRSDSDADGDPSCSV